MSRKAVYEEEDKFRKQAGRKAEEEGRSTEFLDDEALEEDLVDPKEAGPEDEDGRIVSSDHPENEEWHAREEQNRT